MDSTVKAVRTECDATRQKLEALEHSLETAMGMAVRASLKGACPSHLYFGFWSCNESPTGECVYDGNKKSGMDDCLFCQGRSHVEEK